MTLIHSRRLPALFLGAACLVSCCAAANAAEVLFKDDFQIAPDGKTLADINKGARDHQRGTLAPVAYASSGDGWQCKVYMDSSGGRGIRLYPSGNRIPLVLSPAWKLSEKPGDYSLALQIQPRSWMNSEEPEKILVAVGTAGIGGIAGAPSDFAGAVLVEITIDRTKGTRSLRVLFDRAEAAPPVALSGWSDLTEPHDVALRWKQAASRRVDSLSVEVDGAKAVSLPKAGFALRGQAVVFGGQVGPAQQLNNPFADMTIRSFRYARE